MIAAVHLSSAVSIPVAVAVAILVLWYWKRLGDAGVPVSRRRIRRASIVVVLAGLPILVRAVSFVDYQTQQAQYVVTWLLVLVCIGLLLIAAAIDFFDTVRLTRLERHRQYVDAIAAAARARARHEQEQQEEEKERVES
jgi:uncharacterized membrane protein YedE/YeeE